MQQQQQRLALAIHPLFWVFAGLLGFMATFSWIGTLIWVVVILISVLVHELGHALTAIAFGQNTRIHLVMFGGVTYRSGKRISLPKEFLVTLNGPVAGLVLGALSYWALTLLAGPPMWLAAGLQVMVLVNLFWSLINLLPVLPLDGGHLLRIVLEAIFGVKGTAMALMAGVVLGSIVAIAAFVLGWFIIGALFFILTFESFRGWQAYRHASEMDRSEDLQQLFRRAEQEVAQGRPGEARTLLEEVRNLAGRGLIYAAASELLAKIESKSGETQRAYDLLRQVRVHLSPQGILLLHRMAYESGDYRGAVDLAKDAYQLSPGYDVAFINARCHAALAEARAAIGWLQTAVREGIPEPKSILQSREFDAIRDDPKFQELERSVRT